MRVLLCVPLVCAALAAGPLQESAKTAKCDGSTVEDYSAALAPKARTFLAELRTAVKSGDSRKVAAMAAFPLRVNFQSGGRSVKTSAEFIKDYDRIFTPKVRKAIETQVPECLFANWQGVMIGNGEVWFDEQKSGALKIKALNP